MNMADPVAFKVLNEIGIIDQLATHAFTQVLPPRMSIAQFSILNHFVRLGLVSESPAQLASAFQVSRPTMSNTLARLERSGLVRIEPDPNDGRAKLVSITPAGCEMREECIARLAGPLAEMEAVVPPKLIEGLLPMLSELRRILDALRD